MAQRRRLIHPLGPTATPGRTGRLDELISEAGKASNDYQRLTAQGKLGEAGLKLDALKGVLDRLNALKK